MRNEPDWRLLTAGPSSVRGRAINPAEALVKETSPMGRTVFQMNVGQGIPLGLEVGEYSLRHMSIRTALKA
jgi:hypothetical protein